MIDTDCQWEDWSVRTSNTAVLCAKSDEFDLPILRSEGDSLELPQQPSIQRGIDVGTLLAPSS